MKTIDNVVGYCRVSTDGQKDEGTIDIQVSQIDSFCKSNKYNLFETFRDEGVSGGLEERPGLSELFEYLEINPSVKYIVIFKLDRLARDLYIQEHLIKKLDDLNVTIISIKEPDLIGKDPTRKAFRQLLGIFSELEKNFITMRMSSGRINKAKKGKYAGGGKALGYRIKNKDLIVDPEQSKIIKRIFHMKRYNRMSLLKISEILNQEGIPTARGKKWYPGTIKYILENPIYKGTLSYKDEVSNRDDLSIAYN